MAAYGAVLSLKLTMERISQSANPLSFSETMMSIYNDVDSFLKTMEQLPSSKIVDDAADPERRVKDAVQKLEDLIDSHVSDLSDQSESSNDHEISFIWSLSEQLRIVKEEISLFLLATDPRICRYPNFAFSSSDYNTWNQQQNLLVGSDDRIESLKETISDAPWNDDFVTLVWGMTGIGKTSLVKQMYNDPSVVKEFDTRLFLHIGPRYNLMKEIQLLVLNQLTGACIPFDSLLHVDKYYLKRQLWQALGSQKYLIVLDDVWPANIHDMFDLTSNGFPDNKIGSHVIIISQIQTYAYQPRAVLPFLKEDEGWKLLHQTAFSNSEEKCSRELEKIGKKIARNCEGLPAAIIQVGENLRGKSIQEWEALSQKEDPLVITRDDNTPLSKALHFSYMMLPQYLKLRFLYMGVFPKHYEIYRSKLIKLWLSEGFVDPYPSASSLEGAVGEYLDLLVFRSVVLGEKQASVDSEATKKCRLHFTFRSLCVNEAKSEKFFHIMKKYTDCTSENLRGHQRLCFHNNVVLAFEEVHEWMESVPNARSLLCYGPKQQYPVLLPLCFRLLKILDALAIRFYEFPHQVLDLIHVRYFAITCDGELPNSISTLWNLEVLIFSQHHNIKLSNKGPVYLPIEIWNMHKLKQLYCKGFDLPTPPLSDSYLQNLIILSGVSVPSCTVEVLSRIPNLKRIAVQIESAHDSIETFSFFGHFATRYDKFESFKCVVVNPNLSSHVVRCVPKFPANITKISLSGCGLPWKNIEVIAALPHLAVLKLRWYAFCGPQWIMSDRQFPRLQFLLLEDLDIERWEPNNEGPQSSRRCLHNLIVRHCYKLKSIPVNHFFPIRVEVDDCSISLVEKMRESLDFYGNKMKIRSSATDLCANF